MINRAYDKIIILCYPSGAGGNFLINCLSLTDQCVLRDSLLAEKQLTTGFTVNEKIKYLHDQLSISKQTGRWNDFGLGCENLFGIENILYLNEYPELIQKKINYIIRQLIEQQKYLFIVAHTTQYLDAYFKFWTNARVIFLTDYHDFVNRRYSDKKSNTAMLTNYWNKVRGADWPDNPPTTSEEFTSLPESIQQELVVDFHNEIFRWFDYRNMREELHNRAVDEYIKKLDNRAFDWNVSKNFSGKQQEFINTLHQCANWARIDIVATQQELVKYYNSWLDVIVN